MGFGFMLVSETGEQLRQGGFQKEEDAQKAGCQELDKLALDLELWQLLVYKERQK